MELLYILVNELTFREELKVQLSEEKNLHELHGKEKAELVEQLELLKDSVKKFQEIEASNALLKEDVLHMKRK